MTQFNSEVDEVYEISVRSMLRVFGSPMRTHSWGIKHFTARDVKRFIKENRVDSRPWDGAGHGIQDTDEGDRNYHIARVAYMVLNPQTHPICIDIACEEIGLYNTTICDGNHRLSAAIVRGDKTVRVAFSGGVTNFKRMFRGAKICT
jgi:hypothetical protein